MDVGFQIELVFITLFLNIPSRTMKQITDELNSPTVKSGNVLALLNTLYTSGFAMTSSSTPLIKGKTLHTLYALSFVVYVMNTICSWVHVSFVIKGYVTSFPLYNWVVIFLVVISVTGTMLTWLLFVLCIENAFAHRLDIKPYRSGCALLFEAFIEWTQAFNNFRMSFLIMMLHDAPLTILNFFYLTSCRCPNPQIYSWSLITSTISGTISLLWRITVLYFSYRRMIFGTKKKLSEVGANTTILMNFLMAINTSDGGRLHEYDETWPIRWARIHSIGPHVQAINSDDQEQQCENSEDAIRNISAKLSENSKPCIGNKKLPEYNFRNWAKKIIGFTTWFLLILMAYTLMLIFCCIPCIYHYTCRNNSFYHRHKFCRSFIRYFSMTFHRIVCYSSLLISVILIILNIILLFSVHGLGTNNIPPEINEVCITVSPNVQTVFINILPSPLFQSTQSFEAGLNREFAKNDKLAITECKPLWDDRGLGRGLTRKEAGVWELRIPFSSLMLAVSTRITFNHTNIQEGQLNLEYTHNLFTIVPGRDRNISCSEEKKWKIIPIFKQLQWPYFRACEKKWRFILNKNLIECNTTSHHLLRHKHSRSSTVKIIRNK